MASGSIVLAHHMSNSTNSMTNGHLSPLADSVVNAEDVHSMSDSELSEIIEPPNLEATPSPAESGRIETRLDDMDIAGHHSSVADTDLASEDADFDLESPPPQPSEQRRSERSSSSQESQRPSKRKAGAEADDFILNNPELYGLRRSGRARHSRPVVETTSEDENGSGSDIVSSMSRKRRKVATSQKPTKRPTQFVQRPSSSDSESDDYARAGRRMGKKKNRRPVESDSLAPSHAEVRFSTRRAAKISNYNEDDEDGFSEDEAMLTPNYSATGPAENVPAIDIVLNHRLKDETDTTESEPGKNDFEYFIKMQGLAHYHATWETTLSLSSLRGLRKLENYYRKVVSMGYQMDSDPDIAPEEREQWSLDREREMNSLNEHMRVERVIGKRDGEVDTEYFVKWKGLFYDSCTWETASLVSQIAQNEIDAYLDRTSYQPSSNKSEANLATRRGHTIIREQPDYIKHGQLKDFQVHGLNFLAYNWCKGNNVVLADEMGLGKTVQTVAFLDWLKHDRQQQGPFLVVVPLSTMPSWAETFDNWTPDINYVVYNGNDKARNVIKEYELLVNGNPTRAKFNVLLTTYEYILVDSSFLSQIKWQFMAVDEAHRLKNRSSQLYRKLLEFKAPSRLLITGTPMQNTLGELAALMDFLMPGVVDIDDNLDLQAEAASQKIAEMTAAIQPYMLRRTKGKVENDIPPKCEKIIRVELSDIQLEYYKNILTRNYSALNRGSKGQKQSLLNIMMELKKASNHPFMFPNAEDRILGGSERRDDTLKALITSSGKMMLLDQLLKKLKRDNHRVLIFSQMVKMLDILGDYLHLRGYQFQRLDGTIAAEPRRMAIDHFNASDSNDFCFLLSTRAGGLGINLMTADTVVLFDSDWNPHADLQAMARAHRIGQRNPVTIYRLVSKETVEEEVLERARNKLMLEFVTIQKGVTDKDAKELTREITDKMVKAGRPTAEPNSSDDITKILKRRGQKMFEQSGNQKKLEELDIDSVLENAEEHKTEAPEGIEADGGEEFLKSFEYMDVKIEPEWDEVFPPEVLKAIKAEEQRKAEAKYLQQVIEQNAPRKRKAADEDREQRAAKKRARELAAAEAGDESDEAADLDPARPLEEKEIRNLIRGYTRYGALEDRHDEIVQDAGLVGRDPAVLKATIDEITNISQEKTKEEQDRMDALERSANRPTTRKDRKAVLFDYHGVKRLNAETILERPGEMRMLREVVNSLADFKNFRVAEASKAANYTASWGAREDGMLCVGIARHGYGAWVPIRDDPDLGLEDKFFLEEHRVEKKEQRTKGEDKNVRSPGAVHLVRRADYLLSVLKDKTSNGTNMVAKRALENHHRNNRKNGIPASRRDEKSSASPAPSSLRKGVDKHRYREPSSSDLRNDEERRASHGESSSSKAIHKRTHSNMNGDRRPSNYRKEEGHQRKEEGHHRKEEGHQRKEEGHHRKENGYYRKEEGYHRKDDSHHPKEESHHRKDEHRHRHHSELPSNKSAESRRTEQQNASRGDTAVLDSLFKDIKSELEELRRGFKELPSDQKVKALRSKLKAIGSFVKSLCKAETSASSREAIETQLWTYVLTYWPNSKVKSPEAIRQMYERIAADDMQLSNPQATT